MAKAMGGVYTWIHSDHLHSATILTDESGTEVRRLAYRAFGEEAENTGSGTEPTYSYTGKERDATGLLYYGARYYDPALSRFITADTIYDRGPQGLNRYSYALNNPIRYHDPSGHLSYDDTAPVSEKLENFYDPAMQDLHEQYVGEGHTAEEAYEHVFEVANDLDGDGTISDDTGRRNHLVHDCTILGIPFKDRSGADLVEESTYLRRNGSSWAELAKGYHEQQSQQVMKALTWMAMSAAFTSHSYDDSTTVPSDFNKFNLPQKSKLTKGGITEYLNNVKNIPREQLIRDIESTGLRIKGQSPDGRFMEFIDRNENVRAKIHPPDKVTTYHHLHMYDSQGGSLDKTLVNVNFRDLRAHIEIAEP